MSGDGGGATFHGGRHSFSDSTFGSGDIHHHAPPAPAPSERAGSRGARGAGGPVADAVVVTAIASEYAAVAAHLSGPFEERDENGTLYRIGTLHGSRSRRRVALVQVGPGNVDAGVSLERARTAFSPEVILFVGVAGGVKDVRLGDVVVADSIYDYETGKENGEGFLSGARTAAPSHAAVQRAMDVVFRQEWTERILTAPPPAPPRAFVKPVAAGSKVVASGDALTAERLRLHCRDAVAVEMEGYGFLRSAYLASGTHSLVVRGISDLLSGKTGDADDFWQPVAAAHAAAFACEFLDLFGSEA
jgi:nucleoside phosphorylase